MSPLSKEWQYPAIMSAVAVFFLLLFYLDYSRTIDIGNREAIGYITYKNNRVQRKFEDQVVWSNLENNSALTNRDTIRSEKLSDAVIHLNDGTIIKIDENSMFFLDLSGAKPKLSFHTGAVQVQQGADGQTELVIQTGDRTINVASGSDLKIESSDSEELSLIMQKGNASIQTKSGTHAIGADQKASLSGEGVTVREVKLKLKEPANQSVVPLKSAASASGQVPLRWEVREKFSDLRYEVSRSRDFRRVEKSGAAGPRGATIAVPPGSYYWRLRGKNQASGKTEFSEVRKLSVVPNTPVRLSAPARGARLSYVLEPPLVGFAWSSNPLANRYVLEIASDSAFRDNVRRIPVNTNSVSVPGMQAGSYYWRVRSQSGVAGVPEQLSQAGSFRIERKEGFDVPQPGAPAAGVPLARDEAREGVTFAWRASPEMDLFQVQISKDPSFQTIIVDEQVSRSYFENPVTETGTYYWRVRGSSGGKQSSFSTSVRFEVLERSEIAARQATREEGRKEPGLEARTGDAQADRELAARQKTAAEAQRKAQPTMAPIAPVNTRVNVSGKSSIGFRWKAARGARGYRFRLYRGSGGGRKLVLERNVNRPAFTLNDFSKLDVGGFSWEVHAKPISNKSEKAGARFSITTDSRLDQLRPEDIEFISPDTIYKE